MKRSRSGAMALSCRDTRYELGMVFQAGSMVSLPVKAAALVGGCVAARSSATRLGRPPANRPRNFDGSR
jgi:hypothetical protein